MKNIILSLFTVILLGFKTNIYAGDNPPTRIDYIACLELEGKITNFPFEKDSLVRVELLCDNDVIDVKTFCDGSRKFKFFLLPNLQYRIRITREGYASRIIAVDTHLPSQKNRVYRFYFTTRLLKQKESPTVKKNIIEKPLALVFYHPKRGYFFYKKYKGKKLRETELA